MYYFLSILTGIVIAVMIVVNGELSEHYGLYLSTLIIFFTGLVTSTIWLLFKRKNLKINKKLPFYLFIGGGLAGSLTIIFNSISFAKLSVSALLALGLLGQIITSIFIDNYGLFKMQKIPFRKRKFLGIIFLIAGIGVMLTLDDLKMFGAIVISLLAGLSIVLSRTFNARLADETNMSFSVFCNFATGFVFAFIVFVFLVGLKKETLVYNFSPNVWIYFGGILGILVVILSNLTVTKISSFYITLLLFIGQISAGIILDIIITHTFFWGNLVGGLLVTIGLTINLWFDKKLIAKQLSSD